MKFTEQEITLIVLLLITLSCIFLKIEGVKDIVIATVSGILGYLTKGSVSQINNK